MPELSGPELAAIFSRIKSDGDPLSKVAAVEVALEHLHDHPELETFITAVVRDFIQDGAKDDRSDFTLYSWVAILIASQLSRKKVFYGQPPFYRKQAALSQASLVMRAFSGSRVDRAETVRWAKELNWSQDFYIQGLVDLRSEPRWLPDFISGDQIRFDFLGRIRNAAAVNESKIKSPFLRSLLLGAESPLWMACEWPFAGFPGPLEGALKPHGAVPHHVLDQVRDALGADILTSRSFAGLVNLSMAHPLPGELADLAAKALKRTRYTVENLDEDGVVFSMISGLAVVASVTRSEELSEAVRVLARVLRRRKRFTPGATDEIRIALVAAAAFEEQEKWAEYVGDWLTELAFEVSDRVEAANLLVFVREVARCEPLLARGLAKAKAALAAFAE